MKNIYSPYLLAGFILIDFGMSLYAFGLYYLSHDPFTLTAAITLIIGPILITHFLLRKSKRM